jgi:hypothetical protein
MHPVNTSNRYCSICNCDLVGDEYHYLLECKSNEFVKLRESYLIDLIRINENFKLFDKISLFLYLMSMKDVSIVKKFSKYCYTILSIVKEYL